MEAVKMYGNAWMSGVHNLIERYPKERKECKVSGYDFGNEIKDGVIVQRRVATKDGFILYNYKVNSLKKRLAMGSFKEGVNYDGLHFELTGELLDQEFFHKEKKGGN